jgi:Sap, sulfolipid-1-addressing protein
LGSLLVQVAIYGLAAAFAAPIAIVVSALILERSKRPLASVWTFVAGAAFLDVVFSIVILASGAFDNGGDAGAYVDVGLGVLFLAMGGLALFGTESPEKDAARQARADSIASAPLGKLFLAGLAVQVINFDAIAVFGGALKEIAKADITTGQAILATLFGLAIMLSVYYAPAVLYMLVPERSGPILGRLTRWIMANSRMLEVVVGLGFGTVFLLKGLVVLV